MRLNGFSCLFTTALVVMLAWQVGTARASDVAASAPIATPTEAQSICPQTCAAHKCAWSGEWRTQASPNGGGAVCDCGIKRTRHIPGGVIRSDADARSMCLEICNLNDDKWDGVWESVPGAYAVCGCTYVSDYCPTDKK